MKIPQPPQWHRQLHSIAVTGTDGKTSTVWLLARLLTELSGVPVPSSTTLGLWLGKQRVVPREGEQRSRHRQFLELLDRGRACGSKYAVIEMTAQALAHGMARAWPVQDAIFSNLSHDHIEAHGSPEHYLASKAQLFAQLPRGGRAVLAADDPASELLCEVLVPGVEVYRFGLAPFAVDARGLYAEVEKVSVDGSYFRIRETEHGRSYSAQLALIGSIYVKNALSAILACRLLGYPMARILPILRDIPTPPGRMQLVRHRPLVFVDYAHSPAALNATLQACRELNPGELVLVFGAGGGADRAKRPRMGEAARAADKVIVTNDNPRHESPDAIAKGLLSGLAGHRDCRCIFDRRAAIETAIRDCPKDGLVLIAGKGHETGQIIGDHSLPFDDVAVATANHARPRPSPGENKF